MNHQEKIASLKQVRYFSRLDDATLHDIARSASLRHFEANQRVVSELEFGADVFVIARGSAEVFVQPQVGERQLLDTLGPGAVFGEMASITGELRSATVRALTPLDVLVIRDRDFDALRVRRPEIAVEFVAVIAERLAETQNTLRTLLADRAATLATSGATARPSTLRLLWHEMVVTHQKELTFLTLWAFVFTLICIRCGVYLAFKFDAAPRQVLRAAYVSGFGLVMVSAGSALLTFRPSWRRAIALAYGIGSALIVNELGVTLAFDIYYKDIFTPDPTLAFDIERLYRRTEPVRATVVGLLVLVQAVYLRAFYAHVWYLLRVQLRKLLRNS